MQYDTVSLRRRLESGFVLDPVEKRQLELLLVQDTANLQQMQEEVKEIQKKLLVSRRHFLFVKALVTPLQRIPAEIWKIIFIHCLPAVIFIVPNSSEAPLLLCQICSFLRCIALDTPELWASIKIRRSDWKQVCYPRGQFIKLWLIRASTRALNISFTPDRDKAHKTIQCDGEEVINIIDLCITLFSQWKVVRFCGTDLSQALLRSGSDVPKCEALEELQLYFTKFQSKIDSIVSFRWMWASGQPLRFTVNRLCLKHFYELLHHAKKITYCKVEDLLPLRIDSPPKSLICCPHLAILELDISCWDFETVFEVLVLPALCRLHIHNSTEWLEDSFADFLRRSNCSITDFSLTMWKGYSSDPGNVSGTESAVANTLREMSHSLLHLRLCGSVDAPLITEQVLKSMTYGDTSGQLCPLLQSIDFDDYCISAKDGALSKMIISRLNALSDTPVLRKINLTIHCPEETTMHKSDIAALESLGEHGLDFTYEVISNIESLYDVYGFPI